MFAPEPDSAREPVDEPPSLLWTALALGFGIVLFVLVAVGLYNVVGFVGQLL